MTGPLEGLKVFDLTRVLAGPWCTQILGDLGAEIVKVERPGAGDDTRGFAPPFIPDDKGEETGESAYFAGTNRNKRSITIDISSPEGQALARRLIAECDILVENFKVGALAKYNLAWDQLKDQFPRLIYCSITGFGATGPYAERPGYDGLVQAMGGIMSLTGEPDGAPMKIGVPIADLMAGMYATVSVLAAVRHQEATGEGQHIDIGMLDTHVAWLANQGMNYLATGEDPPRLGNQHPNIVPYQVMPTADGYIVLSVGNDPTFERFCKLAGCEELLEDERFQTNATRVTNRAHVTETLNEITAKQTSAWWLENLEQHSIGCGPINSLSEVFADPQVASRHMVLEMDHPATGTAPVKLIASPIRMTGTPVAYRHAPPTLGQHTEEVLAEMLGLSVDEVAKLRDDGVV
ncbi:MAG: CaiB/BaiF CoA-transferase family protein [Alphaproteobacteria bacterium]|jgi:crotonobetainyl-CoA:carnitine CoA-transferase CaiB-like acyl-CoA transferase|nr:CaiB/BaiF CoA-transferase family protein [Alphaproteobacteria bacterium]